MIVICIPFDIILSDSACIRLIELLPLSFLSWRGIGVLVWAGVCQIFGMHVSEAAGRIFSVWSSVELFLTWSCVASWSFAHLPHMGLPMSQKLVKSGSRICGTHSFETSGWIYTIWISVELSKPVVVQHLGLMTLTLDFKVKCWKSHIIGIGGPIDKERKRCESIGSGTHFVALDFDLSHDLDLEFSRSNFGKAVF